MHHEISLKVNDSSVLETIYSDISGSARLKQVKFIFGALVITYYPLFYFAKTLTPFYPPPFFCYQYQPYTTTSSTDMYTTH